MRPREEQAHFPQPQLKKKKIRGENSSLAHTLIFEDKKTEYYMTGRFHQNKNFQVETRNNFSPQKSILFSEKTKI